MTPSATTALVSAILLLPSCAPPQEGRESISFQEAMVKATSFSVAETARPAAYFSNFCLKNLPNFEGADDYASKFGWDLREDEGGKRSYATKATNGPKFAVMFHSVGDGNTACGMGFPGSTNIDAVNAQILAAATKHTGGRPRLVLGNSHFHYGYLLRNGSVLTHNADQENGWTWHVFEIRPPIREDNLADFLQN